MKTFPLHTAFAIATVGLVLTGAPRLWPSIKGPQWSQLAALADFTPETTPLTPLVPPAPPQAVLPVLKLGAAPLLEDSNGALDRFYQALWLVEKGQPDAIARIVHYGDSPTTADLITGDIRTLLQRRYGNAGHGFVLVAKPWAWYQHTGVELSASGWQMLPASRFETHDGLFGLAGVSITGAPGASSQITFRDSTLTRFELWFLQQPDGGAVAVSADGTALPLIETAGDAKTAGFAPFEIPSGVKTLSLHVQSGHIRLFGIAAEKPGPGVVYDSLGLNGASITVISRMFQEAHLAEELGHRHPNLVILNYGTNEADFDSFVDHQYEKELREAIRRLRHAVPEASLLVMSPMDRGHRVGLGDIETMPTIPRIVQIQRRVARETGCGFFDTFTAMGGPGTMARWYTQQPRLVSADLIHPYPNAGKMIAQIFTREIAGGLDRFKLVQAQRR